jgi:PHD-finger
MATGVSKTQKKVAVSETKEKELTIEKDECRVCGKNVIKDGIQCEICDEWNHSKCAGITAEAYEFISSNDQTHWYCNSCNKGTSLMIKEMKRLQEKVQNFELLLVKHKEESKKETEKIVEHQQNEVLKEIEKLTKEMKDIQKEVSKVLQNADTQISTSVKKQELKWSEVVSKQVDNELKIRSTEVENMHKGLAEAKGQYDDMQDKENRRNNIILYRARESEAFNTDDRNKEDVKFCMGLFHAINAGVDKEDVSKVFRLGKRGDDASQPPRPILVQLASRIPKNLIMEKLYELKYAETKYKAVMVAHDMTKKEREEVKALVDEAKEKTKQETTGEWIHVVRGQQGLMKILRIKKSK